MKTFKGFSLTEVLVVTLIITVLASIFFPALTSSKKAANKVVCISNLHQIYLAMKLYEGDYGEYPPDWIKFSGFRPYMTSLPVCPAKRRTVPNQFDTDYWQMAAPIITNPGGNDPAVAAKAFEACKEIRGPDIPLVMDMNHVPLLLRETDLESFYLVQREAGNIDRIALAKVIHVQLEGAHGSHWPYCDGDIIDQNYNL